MATPVGNVVGLTGTPQIDGLVQGAAWAFSGARTLTYSLSINDTPSGGPWSAYPLIAQAVTQAFQLWANVANISFLESGSGGVFVQSSADIAVTLTGDELMQALGAIGLGIIPDPAFASLVETGAGYDRSSYPQPEGDVFFDNFSSYFASPLPGSLGFIAIVHEIGHALGLKHPHDNGGNYRPTFASQGIASQDSRPWTVMSTDAVVRVGGALSVTPMILDIQAIQHIYGANLNYRTGDDTYTLSEQSNSIYAIWDAGGNDTISAAGSVSFTGARIDLRPGSFNTIGAVSQPYLEIAYNVVIENAIGTALNDEITGNSADNTLQGGDGNDTFDGGAGNDTLIGGTGADTYRFGYGSGQDSIQDFQSIGATDTVTMLSPLLPSNITISRLGTSIVLRISGTSDQVMLDNLEGSATRNVRVSFSNATNWDSTYLSANANDAPVVTAPAASQGHGLAVAAATLFSVSDAEGNAITQYRFVDDGAAGSSGYFRLNGSRIPSGQSFTVSASQLANLEWVAGDQAQAESVRASAYDGIDWGTFTTWAMTTVGNAPIVTSAGRTAIAGQAQPAANLFNVTDADGDSPLEYRFDDEGIGQSTGYFSLNGVRQPNSTLIVVPAAQLATLQWVGGSEPGTDLVWVRAADAIGLGPWVSFSISTQLPAPNARPVVSAPNRTVAPGQRIGAFGLFTVSDAENDFITEYRFADSGNGANSGYFEYLAEDNSRVRMPANTNITVNALTIMFLSYVGGAEAGTETLWARAADNGGLGLWTSFTVTTAAAANNARPQVTAQSRTFTTNEAVAASTLFTVSDAEGDAIQEYRFADSGDGANSGYFNLSGIRQNPNTLITVAANQLPTLQWVGGSEASTETVWFKAADAGGVGPWASATFTTNAPPPNARPQVTAQNRTFNANQAVTASTLFTVSDPEGDAIQEYRFADSGDGAGSGYFSLNGVRRNPNTLIVVAANQLANLQWVGGSEASIETVWFRAADAGGVGPWGSATFTTNAPPPNSRPQVTVQNRTFATNQMVAASTLFTVSDAEGDAIQEYRFADSGDGANSGFFSLNGLRQNPNTLIVVAANQLDNLQWNAGSEVGSETAWVRAADGGGFGPWTSVTLTTQNLPPSASIAAIVVNAEQSTPVSSFFSATDSEGEAIVWYEFADGDASGGHFRVNGIAQVANDGIFVRPADLADTQYVGGRSASTETLWARAYDGFRWSEWKSATATTQGPANSPPVVLAHDATVGRNETVVLSTLLDASDPDGDPIVQYEIYDGGQNIIRPAQLSPEQYAQIQQQAYQAALNSGLAGIGLLLYYYQQLGSHLPPSDDPRGFDRTGMLYRGDAYQKGLTTLALTPDQLATTLYSGGVDTGGESLRIRASDGRTWSEWSPWTMTTVSDSTGQTVNANTQAEAFVLTPGAQPQTFVGGLYSSSGPGYPADHVDWYRFDLNATARVRFDAVPGGILSSDLGLAMRLRDASGHEIIRSEGNTGAPAMLGKELAAGTYYLSVEATGGLVFSGKYWLTASTGEVRNQPPKALAVGNVIAVGHSLPASSLFGYSDPDGDLIDLVQFQDDGASDGFFTLNGVVLPALQPFVVAAENLAHVRYVAGPVLASENFRVRANDGGQWSEWSASSINTIANRAPQPQWTAFQIGFGQSLMVPALLDPRDPDGDVPAGYEFTDNTPSGARFTLNGQDQQVGVPLYVDATEAGNVRFIGASSPATDSVSVRVFDGALWSEIRTFQVITQNRFPIVTALDRTVVRGESVAISQLFSVSDPDGDPITSYRLWNLGKQIGDRTLVTVDGQPVLGHPIEISAEQLANTRFTAIAGWAGGSFAVDAFDGREWSPFADSGFLSSANVPVDSAGNFLEAARNIVLSGASLAVNDWVSAQNDPDDYFRFVLAADAGVHLGLSGSTADADLQMLDVAGQPLAISSHPGIVAEAIDLAVPAGIYFARVYASSGDHTAYSLAASLG